MTCAISSVMRRRREQRLLKIVSYASISRRAIHETKCFLFYNSPTLFNPKNDMNVTLITLFVSILRFVPPILDSALRLPGCSRLWIMHFIDVSETSIQFRKRGIIPAREQYLDGTQPVERQDGEFILIRILETQGGEVLSF